MTSTTIRHAAALTTALAALVFTPTDHASATQARCGYHHVNPDRTNGAVALYTHCADSYILIRIYPTDPRPNHDLAQVVQASGAGAALYAKHERWAEAVTSAWFDDAVAESGCTAQAVPGPIPVHVVGNTVVLPPQAGVSGTVVAGNPQVAKAIGAAFAWLGTPYAWGGGDENGPTRGVRDGGVADAHGDYLKVAFDCSGLTLYAYAQVGARLTRPSDSQLTGARVVVPFSQALPGDLLFWGTHHVALYLGVFEGVHRMVEAPSSGDVAKVSPVRLGGDFRGVAARPVPQP
ncbi:hypothetical protein SUDANB95_04878 [Actinosynnema sp. ALI-1.44]